MTGLSVSCLKLVSIAWQSNSVWRLPELVPACYLIQLVGSTPGQVQPDVGLANPPRHHYSPSTAYTPRIRRVNSASTAALCIHQPQKLRVPGLLKHKTSSSTTFPESCLPLSITGGSGLYRSRFSCTNRFFWCCFPFRMRRNE